MRTSSDITSESKGYANKFGYELLYEIAPQHIGSNFQREKTDEMFFISELNAPRLRITPFMRKSLRSILNLKKIIKQFINFENL